jgi:hypothetical protein
MRDTVEVSDERAKTLRRSVSEEIRESDYCHREGAIVRADVLWYVPN